MAKIRSNGHIALAFISSGNAAKLIEGGRTAHSALKKHFFFLSFQFTATQSRVLN
uniref:ATP-dependent DNA helicase n=1 Tax=Triatoma infestans TaxID=30076 RepID=A0A161MDY8_TRIIF